MKRVVLLIDDGGNFIAVCATPTRRRRKAIEILRNEWSHVKRTVIGNGVRGEVLPEPKLVEVRKPRAVPRTRTSFARHLLRDQR